MDYITTLKDELPERDLSTLLPHAWRHDTQHNGTKHIVIQHNNK